MDSYRLFLVAGTLYWLASSNDAWAQSPPPVCAPDIAIITCAQADLKFLNWQHDMLMQQKQTAERNEILLTPVNRQIAFNEQTRTLLNTWFGANAAFIKATDAQDAAQQRIAQLEAMRGEVRDGPALDKLIEAEGDALLALTTALASARTAQDKAWSAFLLRRNVAVALVAPPELPAPDPVPVQAAVTPRLKPPCSIEDAASRATLKPNDCVQRALALSSALSVSAVTIPGRPLDRRGLFTSITGSKDSTTLSLGWADEFKRRIPYNDGAQRVFTIGYGLSVKSDGGDLLSFKPEKDGETIGALDRLATKSSFSGTLSFNWYPYESAKARETRGAVMAAAARKDCLAEQGEAGATPSTCQGQDLITWIFARDSKRGYAHPTHVEAFNSFYFGSPEQNARRGLGVTVEYARPGFTYIDAAATTPDQIGALMAAGGTTDRHSTWGLTGFAYWRLPEAMPNFDITMVGSLTYKRDWKEADTALFCPAIDTSLPFSTAACTDYQIAAPRLVKSLVPGIEARMIWNGFRLGRWLMPQVAMAPKFTWDSDDDRKGIELPLYFGVTDDKSLTAGLKYARGWDGTKADGSPRDTESAISIVVGKTFTINPR